MRLNWTVRAQDDLRRVHGFLVHKNKKAAAAAVEVLAEAPNRLVLQPHIGERVETITARDVRRILVGDYEIRYDVLDEEIRALRIFHSRENR